MPKLFIVGMGIGSFSSLGKLDDERLFRVRTFIFHSAPIHLEEQLSKWGFRVISLQKLLKGCPPEETGERSVELIQEILEEEKEVALLLPGRPWIGELLVSSLKEKAAEGVFSLEMIYGDDAWGILQDRLYEEKLLVNPGKGITLLDAHCLKELYQPPGGNFILSHACCAPLFPWVKERLQKFYLPKQEVRLLRFNEKGDLSLIKIQPLEEMEVGEKDGYDCWTFLCLGPSSLYSLGDMVAMMEKLRSPVGCPWDRQQDHYSLRPYLLEETYEVLAAIERGDPEELCEELGDLLLQVVFHSQLAAEGGKFSIWRVIDGITSKIYRRHPHVFQRERVNSAHEVSIKWQKIKKQEKKGHKDRFALPEGLPALMKAQKVQKRAADFGFDWPDIEGAFEKLKEEIEELENAYLAEKREKIEEELGDLFFALVNIARFLEVEAELALQKAVEKFKRRFKYVEAQVNSRGGDYSCFSLEELDRWWDEAKMQEN